MHGVNSSFQLATFAWLLYIIFAARPSNLSGSLFAVETFLALPLCTSVVCSGRGAENAFYGEVDKARNGTRTLLLPTQLNHFRDLQRTASSSDSSAPGSSITASSSSISD
ncbi:hypothetical protein K432DRAFT_129651 [Lepidopterella palustris CBS 459.81]|uniref:Secreted protein n=1 Tax=Lepidopterella palustris CBS 459.81 TaxID=1314670 RepID=A0A8E2JC43_9PEZI|nr:hypothetical protein K432DRAFT_129651 [Lepidopterella palustris CBS 459.81]